MVVLSKFSIDEIRAHASEIKASFEQFLEEEDNIIFTRATNNKRYIERRYEWYVFLSHEKRISDLFNKTPDNQIGAFNSYYNTLKSNFTVNQLKGYIRFEFFHESKLNGYYKDVFEQVLGDRDFLNNLMINTGIDSLSSSLETRQRQNALQFLIDFTDKVRNNIAHENSEFILSDDEYGFDSVVSRFLQIIKSIEETYMLHTGFEISLPQENLLDISY